MKKSKGRKELSKHIAKKFQRLDDERERKRQGQRTAADTLRVIVGMEATEAVEQVQQRPRPVVLYLREGLSGAERNWTKYPNEMHDLMTEMLTPYENVVYVRLWRESWGYGRNYCRIGYRSIIDNTSLTSRSTVVRAITGLREKHFIVLALEETGEANKTQAGSLYRIFTPEEIKSGRTEEGVSLESIPTQGILCENIPENPANTRDSESVSTQSIPRESIPRENSTLTEYTGVSTQSILSENTPDTNTDNERPGARYSQREYTQREHTFKERKDIKDTLSPEDIVTGFYNSIGQSKVSKQKREKAEKDLAELLNDNFTLEDIQFAVEWTIQNAKEKLYDFSIISHTMGQAMAKKERLEEIERQRQERLEEEKRQEAANKKQMEEQAKIEAHKQSMSEEDRADLREKALRKLNNTEGIRPGFVGEPLIRVTENEILKETQSNTEALNGA